MLIAIAPVVIAPTVDNAVLAPPADPILMTNPASRPAIPLPAVSLEAPAISDEVRRMVEAAIASGDEKSVEIVVRFARLAAPRSIEVIDRMQRAFRHGMEKRRAAGEQAARAALAAAGPLERWEGQAEIGATRSTGNTRSLGIYASLNAERRGLAWRHKFTGRAELQQTDGVTTTERALLSWQPNYAIRERLYAYGLAQIEHDSSLDYDSRYTGAGGLGYGVVAQTDLKLEVEGGPALRYTDETADREALTLAGRASVNVKWKLAPALELSQNGAFYYEPGDSNASVLTAVDTRLLGALKARFSYNFLYESDTPPGTRAIDTVTRVTLVYAF